MMAQKTNSERELHQRLAKIWGIETLLLYIPFQYFLDLLLPHYYKSAISSPRKKNYEDLSSLKSLLPHGTLGLYQFPTPVDLN